MIGTVLGESGKPVVIEGVAGDYGKVVCAIEFSLDDGEHWTRYDAGDVRSGLNLYWSFEYTPREAGTYRMLIRSINEEGDASPEPACVNLTVS